MNFSLRKNKSETKKREIKKRKIKKRVGEIKINIDGDAIVKSNVITKVFKFTSVSEINDILNTIASNIRLKLLINYSTNNFYIFKTEHTKKKKKLSSVLENNQLNSEEIANLLKSFYSQEEMCWNDSFLKKPKKMKYEIAPSVFNVNDNYLVSEDRYINVISFEHLGDYLNIENVLKNNDCWLSIDCYKVDGEYTLNKLDEMKKDDIIEKKFSSFISSRIEDITDKLKEEIIFQCEIKLLLYDVNLEHINEEITTLRQTFLDDYCTSYMPQEKVNTRRLFERCIYPNINMDIIHSIVDKDLFNMIGSDS